MKDIRLLFFLLCLVCVLDGWSENRVTKVSVDSVTASAQELFFTFNGLSMDSDRTSVDFTIRCADMPFELHKVEFMTNDTVFATIEPLNLKAGNHETAGKITEWEITVDFPFIPHYNTTDRLVVDTDLGRFEMLTSREAILLNENEAEKSRIRTWALLMIVGVSALALVIFLVYNRRLKRRTEQMRQMVAMSEDYQRHANELQTKVNDLYDERMSTLNMLCNEYFERSASEKLRLSLYNKIEQQILEMRSPGAVKALEEIINRYLDDILSRLKEQLPSLTRNDLTFITYLYAGFSPRAISILFDIKIKNFYNRRSRLKEKIASSDAPDKELFIEKM